MYGFELDFAHIIITLAFGNKNLEEKIKVVHRMNGKAICKDNDTVRGQ